MREEEPVAYGGVPVSGNTMGNNEGSVEATLQQRGSVYGPYDVVVSVRNTIMNVLKEHHRNVSGNEMTGTMQVAIGDLVLKLVRGSGAPMYEDSWHDLSGYAKLIEDMVAKKVSKGCEP